MERLDERVRQRIYEENHAGPIARCQAQQERDRTQRRWSPNAPVIYGADGESYIITGSRISRSSVSPENPVTIITGEELRSTGNERPNAAAAAAPEILPSPEEQERLEQERRLRSIENSSARVIVDRELQTPDAPYDPNTIHEIGGGFFRDNEPSPFEQVVDHPVSTFSADVDTASYSYVRGVLSHCYLPSRAMIRTEELVNYFDYDYAVPRQRNHPISSTVWITPTPWNDATELLHIGIRGYDSSRLRRPRLNLVFLVDVSGSMGGRDKIGLVRQSLQLLLDQLHPADHVSIVTYAEETIVRLEPTPARNKEAILDAIGQYGTGGRTAGIDGLETAYELAERDFDPARVNRVIIATDGRFNEGQSDPDELRAYITGKRISGIYLTYLGYGASDYHDVMAQSLAQAGNGNAAYIDGYGEAERILVDEMRGTLFPIADDVKFQFEFNPDLVSAYRLIGYETRALTQSDFSNDQVDAGEMGNGHTATALYEIVRTSEGDAEHSDDNDDLATIRIRYKLPGRDRSNLIERTIGPSEFFFALEDAPHDARFAAAVAAFGQHLRDDPFQPGYDLDDIYALAASGIGDDEDGWRAEFLELIQLTQRLESEPEAAE